MAETPIEHELKRGSMGLLILAALEERERHGYDLARQIVERTGGIIAFHSASLYPILYRMERRRLVEGRWVEKAGQRRRRYYRMTPAGRKALAAQRSLWEKFVVALGRAARVRYA